MAISRELYQQVRARADFRCEFCGVSEIDAGGELTLDHFQPLSRGGSDLFENLIYACARCNQYKSNYWSSQENDLPLWNPRRELGHVHFLELDNGQLHPITPVGEFTLSRLRLNRPPLVAHRLRKREQTRDLRLLARYRDIVLSLEQMNGQLSELMQEQRQLLEEEREILKILLQPRE